MPNSKAGSINQLANAAEQANQAATENMEENKDMQDGFD